MNIVRELRKKKGIQQKELALEIGVSCPTVSDWELGKKDPSGERLKKLAKYFEVDELVILGKGIIDLADKPETNKVRQMILDKLAVPIQTNEAKILAQGVDKLPQEQREMALNVVKAMFAKYADYFEKEEQNESEL